jgi:Tol biopolymer transport system component
MNGEADRNTRAVLWILAIGFCALMLPCCQNVKQRGETIIKSEESVPLLTQSSEPVDEPRWPSLPGSLSGQEIAYLSNRTGLAEIWLLDLATGSERQLTATDCSAAPIGGHEPEWYQPGVDRFAWSPDGRRIAYLSKCTSAGHLAQLNVVDLESYSIVSLTEHVSSYSYPSWDPSGSRFVFEWDEATCGMSVVDMGVENSVNVKQITDDSSSGCYHCPSWSPDSEHLAYRGPYVGVAWRTYISIVDLEGNHLSYRPECPDGDKSRDASWIAEPNCGDLVWSHDGKLLAIAAARGYVPGGLKLVRIDRQTATVYDGLISRDWESFGPDFYAPVFSASDETLFFVSSWPDAESGWPLGTIYGTQVDDLLDGSSPLDIHIISPENQLSGFPALSQNGEWLLYSVKTGEAIEVWLQAVDGTFRQRLVADEFINTRPMWRPGSR